MQRSFKARMEALERARWERLTPLERAYELIDQQVPVEQWPDAELEAYCTAECQHLECLTDVQVDTLVACASADEQQRLYAEMTGQPWPA